MNRMLKPQGRERQLWRRMGRVVVVGGVDLCPYLLPRTVEVHR